jgi:hypothetical protein
VSEEKKERKKEKIRRFSKETKIKAEFQQADIEMSTSCLRSCGNGVSLGTSPI